MSASFSVLTRNRDFRNLFLAELVVFGADWFVMVPLLVLLPQLTGSGVWGALVLAVDTGIVALLLPYTGTVADRIDRKKILMAANGVTLLGVLLLLLVRGEATAWLALVAITAVAVGKAFYSPAAQAALPNVVDPQDLAAGNAIAGSAWGTMTIVGASLGGVLTAALGPYACFWIGAAALVLAALLAWTIRRPLQAPGDGAPALRTWAAIGEALRYIGQRPRVLALVTVKSAVGLGNGVLTVFPLLAAVYGVGAVGTGLLFAVRGAGALVGPLLMRRVLTRRSWLLPGLALSMSLYGLSYLSVSVAVWFPLVLVGVFVAHFAGGSNWVLSNFALQGEVPDRLRGRVFATDMMLATLAISVSQLAVASMIDLVDQRIVLAACGLTTLLYAIGWWIATRRLSLSGVPAEGVPAEGVPAEGVPVEVAPAEGVPVGRVPAGDAVRVPAGGGSAESGAGPVPPVAGGPGAAPGPAGSGSGSAGSGSAGSGSAGPGSAGPDRAGSGSTGGRPTAGPMSG